GHQHRIRNAVQNRLGVLTLRGGDFELNLKLFKLHRRIADTVLGVADQIVNRSDQRNQLRLAGIQQFGLLTAGEFLQHDRQPPTIAAIQKQREATGGGGEKKKGETGDQREMKLRLPQQRSTIAREEADASQHEENRQTKKYFRAMHGQRSFPKTVRATGWRPA